MQTSRWLRGSIGRTALVAAALAGFGLAANAQIKRTEPGRTPPAAAERVIVVPSDLKSLRPFSGRFVSEDAVRAGRPVIDLKATRFTTDNLVAAEKAGAARFLAPDVSSFKRALVGAPFAAGREDYFIVQALSAQTQSELRNFLDQHGIAILDYIPQNAYLVRVNNQALTELEAVPQARWVGHFKPAYRVDPVLDYITTADPNHQLKIRVVLDRAAYPSVREAEAAIARAGAKVLVTEPAGARWVIRVQGPVKLADTLALLPGCLWVERFVDFQLHNNTARTSATVTTGRGATAGPIMDVESVWARGIHGEGQIVAASDTGLSTGDLTTLHHDFGQQGDASNPMRVIHTYALGRAGNWNDDQNTDGGHGTHTSGSIVGNGVRSGSTPSTDTYPSTCYAGVAPKAQYVFQSLLDSGGGLGGIPADLNNLFQPPYDDGARVHSNSWGAPVSGAYNTDSQNLDEFVWNHNDMVITFSAGNNGVDTAPADGVINADSIGSPGTAKNCITVGASENYRPTFQYEYPSGTCNSNPTWNWFNSMSFATAPVSTDPMADNASGLGAFSSRGPTNDGRIKPDLVAPGVAVISTRTDLNQAFEQWGTCNVPAALKTYYLAMGGTSMANPLTAGAAVLVRQYYAAGWHRNHSMTTNAAANAADGFAPSAALVKATLINGAWDMAPGQYGNGTAREIPPGWDAGHDLPNNAEGYGRVDLMHSLFPGSGWGDDANRKLWAHDVAPGLQTGQFSSYTVTVTSSANPLVVTLVWTDPYGALAAATELVNDLDLTVTAPGGTVYYPNGLNKTSGVDTKNNVEQVKVTAPAAGTYMISVKGTSVAGNGQPGTTTQPFALVVSGIIAPVPSDKDFYVSDWNTSPAVYENGAEPSTHGNFFTYSDVWNLAASTPGPGSPTAGGWYPTENMQAGAGSLGDNKGYVRVRRNASGSGASVTVHFFVSPFGTGSSFVDAGAGADPVLTFGAADTEKVLSAGYPWHQDATSSIHACIAAQISTADDPVKAPSLLGRTPGPDDYLVKNDNNKAQRNLGVSNNTSNGAGVAMALIHNSALFRRDVVLRLDSPAADRLKGTRVEVVGGRTTEFQPGLTVTLERMQPGENRWVAIRHQALEGDPVPIEVSELDGERPANGFAVLARAVPVKTAIRDNLRDHAQLFGRIAAALRVEGATTEADAASRLLRKGEVSERRYLEFVKGHRSAMATIVKPLLGRADPEDSFGVLKSVAALGVAAGRGRAEGAASEHAMLLNRLDAFVTMRQKASGDPADILQMVRWQEALFRTRPALQRLECSALVLETSQGFIAGYARGSAERYPGLLKRQTECFRATVRTLDNRPELQQALAAIERSLASLPALEKTHREFLVALQDVVGPVRN